jgi:hypothetical protein
MKNISGVDVFHFGFLINIKPLFNMDHNGNKQNPHDTFVDDHRLLDPEGS